MNASSPGKETSHADSRERMIAAAIRVFAEKGYDGATVRDLADEAQVNVSMVSYYFEGKEGLYAACIESFGKEKLALAESVLTPPESLTDFRVRLKLWIQNVLATHVEQPDMCSIILREQERAAKYSRKAFEETFLKIHHTLTRFFSTAQKRGILRDDCDAIMVAEMFFLSVISFAQRDKIRKDLLGKTIQDQKYREHLIDEALKFLERGAVEHT